MIDRVSTNLASSDAGFYRKRMERSTSDAQNHVSSGVKITRLSDDPVGASHSTKFQSRSLRDKTFAKNTQYTTDTLKISENHLMQSMDILQRVRELAVKGANGTYSKDDKKKIAGEVEELLKATLDEANAIDPEGNFIFSGSKIQNKPFRIINAKDSSGKESIDAVFYEGDNDDRKILIDENKHISLENNGSDIFWAEKQTVVSDFNASSYTVNEDSSIEIDGHKINLSEGDSINSIISKINNSDASVNAYLDPLKNSLTIEGTTAHQIHLKDDKGTILKDLQVIQNNNVPHNLKAKVSGESIFNTMINLRNALNNNDSEKVGSQALKGIDSSIEKITDKLAKIGAKGKRLEFNQIKMSKEIQDLDTLNSHTVDTDVAQAITNFKELQTNYKAALGITARINQPTLLDFLR